MVRSFPAVLSRLPRRALSLVVSMLLVLAISPALTLFTAQPARANIPSGATQFDAADANRTCEGQELDWACAGTVANPVVHKDDLVGSDSDNVFGVSAAHEDDVNPNTTTKQANPGKGDLSGFDEWSQTVAGKTYLYLAWQLGQSCGGDVHVDFEINQSKTLLSDGLPARTQGDVIVSYDFNQTNVSSSLVITTRTWNAATTSWGAANVLDPSVYEASINGDTCTFGEVGINLSDPSVGIFTNTTCTDFANAFVKTRNSGAGFSANMNDYVTPGSISLSNCSPVKIKKVGPNGELLSGATFTIAKDPAYPNTPNVPAGQSPCTTDATGYCLVGGLSPLVFPGHYIVTETGAPDGYLLPATTTHAVEAVLGQDTSLTVTDPLGSATFEKVDATTPATHVAGATFEVKATGGVAKTTYAYDELVTDNDTSPAAGHVADADPANGVIKVADLYTGTYDVTEQAPAPAGYDVDPNTYSVTVNAAHPDGIWSAAGSTFSDPRLDVALTVFKIKDGTQDSPVGLAGAKFTLYKMLGATPAPGTDTKIDSCTTAANGKCTLDAIWGFTYYWVETSPPPGYSLPVNNVGTPFAVGKSDVTNGITTMFADKSPTLVTSATDNVVGSPIKDTATIGNLRPDATGTVTFKVYGPFASNATIGSTSCSGNLLDTFTVSVVAGQSVYASDTKSVPADTAHVFNAPAAGKYAWVASYSGDVDADGNVLDASVSGTCGDTGETSTVSKASPTITTTASTSNTVDGTIHDTATLHSFFAPASGTVTFNLYLDCNASPIYTSTVSVNKDGDTFTSGDFQLTNAHGTYYWSANYNGDGNNSATNQSNCGLVDDNNNEVSHAPVLDSPHKYNDPGTAPDASTTDTTVSIYPSNNTVKYTITVHNSGAATMNDVEVSDALSPLADYNASSITCGGDAASCLTDDTTSTLTWQFNLAADGTATLTFSVTVDTGDVNGDDIVNQAAVSNGSVEKDTEQTHNPVAFPILAIAKHSNPLPREDNADGVVGKSSTIAYTVTVSNSGDGDAPGTVVTDQIPGGTTYANGTAACPPGFVPPCAATEGMVNNHPTVTWTLTVPAHGSVDLTFSVTVDPGDVNGQIISNHAHYDWQQGTLADDSRTITHIVEFSIITGTKDASPLPREDNAPGIVTLGDTITYTVTATNSGLAASDVTVTDTVPAGTSYVDTSAKCGAGTSGCSVTGPDTNGLITWTFHMAGGTLDGETVIPATAAVTFQVTVDSGDDNGQVLSNFATVNGTTTRTVTHVVEFPIINVVKSSDPASGTVKDPTPVVPGQTITYTLSVTNAGLADATDQTVTDTIPGGTTSNLDAACGQAFSTCSADESNGVITWHLTVPKGSGTEGDITPFTGTLTFSVTVTGTDANGTLIDNTAQFSNTNNPDCVPAGEDGCSTNTTHHEVKFPIVDVLKSSVPASGSETDPAPVTPGQTIAYTLTVTNAGLADATDITVTDTIPAGTISDDNASCGADFPTCSVSESNGVITWHLTVPKGSVDAAFSGQLTFSVTVDAGDGNGTLIDNTAAFTNDHTPDCVPVNEGDCSTNTTHHEVKFPILSLVKTANPPSGSIVQRGDQIDYTITVDNTGLADAPGTVITDNLPAHVTVVPGSINPTADTSVPGVITWTIDVPAATPGEGDLGPTPGEVVLTYSVTVDQDAPEGATLVNEALVNGECPDGSTCTTDHHVPTGDLTLVKHVDKASASYGDTLTYTFDAATTGDLNQTNVTVTDVVPAEVTYVSGSGACTDAGTCTVGYDTSTRTLTWELGDMAAGTTRHLVFKATINTPTPAADGGIPAETIVNSGVIGSSETPKTPSNKVKTVVIAVLGVKHVRKPPPQVLPFTGGLVPAPLAAAVALLLVGAGIVLTSTRRRRQS